MKEIEIPPSIKLNPGEYFEGTFLKCVSFPSPVFEIQQKIYLFSDADGKLMAFIEKKQIAFKLALLNKYEKVRIECCAEVESSSNSDLPKKKLYKIYYL